MAKDDKKSLAKTREQRLADSLRANLKRRKAQAKHRTDPKEAKTSDPPKRES